MTSLTCIRAPIACCEFIANQRGDVSRVFDLLESPSPTYRQSCALIEQNMKEKSTHKERGSKGTARVGVAPLRSKIALAHDLIMVSGVDKSSGLMYSVTCSCDYRLVRIITNKLSPIFR